MGRIANFKSEIINKKYKIFAIFSFSSKSSLNNFQIQIKLANSIDTNYRQRVKGFRNNFKNSLIITILFIF